MYPLAMKNRMPSTAQRSCSPVACNMQSAELHIPEPKKKSRPKTERAIEKKQVVLTDRTGHHQTVQRRKRSCSPVACNMQSAELRIPEPKKKNTIDELEELRRRDTLYPLAMKTGCHQQPRGVAAQLHATYNQPSCTYQSPRKTGSKTGGATEKNHVSTGVMAMNTGYNPTVQRSCNPVAHNMKISHVAHTGTNKNETKR